MEYEYKNVGRHPEDLSDGRVIGVGEIAPLTDEQLREPHNQRLVAEGILVATNPDAEHEAKLAERRESRKTKGSDEVGGGDSS